MVKLKKHKALIIGVILFLFCITSLRVYVPVVEGGHDEGFVRNYVRLSDNFADSLQRTLKKYDVMYIRIGNCFITSSWSYYDINLMATCTMVADCERKDIPNGSDKNRPIP